ncbi:hypothetical protein [Chroococcidiopsis sp. SAG 2025]|nr:hypothetical protein [Chroococcidiopsis sp. SAG 2025]
MTKEPILDIARLLDFSPVRVTEERFVAALPHSLSEAGSRISYH